MKLSDLKSAPIQSSQYFPKMNNFNKIYLHKENVITFKHTKEIWYEKAIRE